MAAFQVSADQKQRTFQRLGAIAEVLVLGPDTERAELAEHLDAANESPEVAAIIVQTPPPRHLLPLLDHIAPDKDIDALGVDALRPACAVVLGELAGCTEADSRYRSQPGPGLHLGPGLLPGLGAVAFVDETVFHQLLRWHHFYDRSTTGAGLVSDGLFHAFSWFATVAALLMVAQPRRERAFHGRR